MLFTLAVKFCRMDINNISVIAENSKNKYSLIGEQFMDNSHEDHYLVKMFGTTVHVFSNIFHLICSMPFIVLTIIGNLTVGFFAVAFFTLEKDINPKIHSFIDCLWWSFATATTVGYGDITPQSHGGKILGIFLMLVGTALFAIYTAFFSKAIWGEDLVIKPRNSKKHQ